MSALNPKRTVSELKEFCALTVDVDGAQRVAFTPVWVRARTWLLEKVAAIPGVETHTDAAGNFWATLRGESERALLISGPLHDAAEMCGAGVPTVMRFVQSLHGISHNKIEDTREEHLEACVTAFDRLAEKTMAWVGAAR